MRQEEGFGRPIRSLRAQNNNVGLLRDICTSAQSPYAKKICLKVRETKERAEMGTAKVQGQVGGGNSCSWGAVFTTK